MGRRPASNALATYLHLSIRTNKMTQCVINRISAFANGKDCSEFMSDPDHDDPDHDPRIG